MKPEDPIREHVFDGIQEYDKRLPNWWLVTLWGAVIYGFGYWIVGHIFGVVATPGEDLDAHIRAVRTAAVQNAGEVTDTSLWALSRNTEAIKSGETVYLTNCAACHRPDMLGQIGPNLADQAWLHGGKPLEVLKTVNEGVLVKGMPGWANVLGPQKTREVVAYLLSKHIEGEPITVAPPWVPGAPQQ